jgi:hypothetical protein
VAARIVQSEALSCDRERLAGGSSDKKVNWSDMVGLDLGEVPEQGDDVRLRGVAVIPIDRDRAEAVFENGAREGFDF